MNLVKEILTLPNLSEDNRMKVLESLSFSIGLAAMMAFSFATFTAWQIAEVMKAFAQ